MLQLSLIGHGKIERLFLDVEPVRTVTTPDSAQLRFNGGSAQILRVDSTVELPIST